MNWKTILLIILAIFLVMIIFFGGFSWLQSMIATILPNATAQTVSIVALSVVAVLCVGIAILVACHPEWLEDICSSLGEGAEILSASLAKSASNIISGVGDSVLGTIGKNIVVVLGVSAAALIGYNYLKD